jgi:hypothetical protein
VRVYCVGMHMFRYCDCTSKFIKKWLLLVFIPVLSTLSFVQTDKLRWWSIFREPEHELVGRIQLYINYTTAADENNMKV